MKFVFFSVNDFVNDGGGTIRMFGILNELAKSGNEVIFISNASNYDAFNKNIKHIYIGFKVSRQKKRIFQACLSILPVNILNFLFPTFRKRVEQAFNSYNKESRIVFFEYIDNSVGYWLYKNRTIEGYINDLHGVATLEFNFQRKSAKTLKDKIKYYFKYYSSKLLDDKVFHSAKSLIFASNAMQSYFETKYPKLKSKANLILPYLLSSQACQKRLVNDELKQELLEKHKIKETEKIVLFAGAFKKTGGVPDLILAFQNVLKSHKNIRLFLIGDGPTFSESQALVNSENTSCIHFLGRTKYNDLATYQDLADIIVCPDRQNVYSELIIHVKYLDALVSGKIVINGSFKSVLEANLNESLSLNFKPSSVNDLASVLKKSLENYEEYTIRFEKVKDYVCDNLTYSNKIEVLEAL